MSIMKITINRQGTIREEEVENGYICRVRYLEDEVANIDLSGMHPTTEQEIQVDESSSLYIKISRAPFLQNIYPIFDDYKGLKLVEFQHGDIKIDVTW